MRDFSDWWGRIGLQRRLQILIQGCLVVILLAAQLWVTNQFEQKILTDAKQRARVVADGTINGLNTLMVTKIGQQDVISDKKARAQFVQKMGATEKIKGIRVIRARQLDDEFPRGLPQEYPVDDMDRSVLASGKSESRLIANGDDVWLRTVVPFIAMKNFRTISCLECHRVNEGTVLGAASITIDIKDDLASIRKINAVIWFGQGVLQIILYFAIGLIARRITSLLGGEPAYVIDIVEQIAKGNLSQQVSTKAGDSTSLLVAVKKMQEARKQAEDALKAERVQLADIISFLPDATLAIDSEKRVIIWNKAIEKMTGIPAAEMLGKGDHACSIPFYGEARPHLANLVFLDSSEITARYPTINRENGSITAEVFCNALYKNKGAWVFAKASPLHDHSGKVIGAIEIIRDITEHKQAEQELKRSHSELRTLSKAASEALEDERRRTARELHDELGQTLTVLKLDLGALRSRLPPNAPDLDRRAGEIQAKLDIMVAATRRIAANLRPMMLDDLGLAVALDWLTQNFSEHTGIAANLDMDDRLAQVQEPIASALFRITQESLTNVTKYAQATRVDISLEYDGNWILLTVRDNGRGISVADQNKTGHFGLLGIRERVILLSGEFAVTGTPGLGTEVRVRIPLVVAEKTVAQT